MAVVRSLMQLPSGLVGAHPPVDGVMPDKPMANMGAILSRFEDRLVRLPPVAARAVYARAVAMTAGAPLPLHRVDVMRIAGCRARLYVPKPADDRDPPVLVFFHGGGGVLGDLDTADNGCRYFAYASGWNVVSIDYRLGPEDPYPAALDDAWATFRRVAEDPSAFACAPGGAVSTALKGAVCSRGTRPKVAVGGASFGALLAAQVCRRARDSGGPMPCGQLLVYPIADFGADTASRRQFGEGMILSRSVLETFNVHAFAHPIDASDPRASILRSDNFSGLPPALVVTAGFDPLRDEGRALAERLHDDSGDVELLEYPELLHDFVAFLGVSTQAEKAWLQTALRWRDKMAANGD